MGGKRPDQYNIDPGEAGATDYKWSEAHQDEHLIEQQKEQFKSNPKDQPMIPQAGVNPALRELRERKQEGSQAEPRVQGDAGSTE